MTMTKPNGEVCKRFTPLFMSDNMPEGAIGLTIDGVSLLMDTADDAERMGDVVVQVLPQAHLTYVRAIETFKDDDTNWIEGHAFQLSRLGPLSVAVVYPDEYVAKIGATAKEPDPPGPADGETIH